MSGTATGGAPGLTGRPRMAGTPGGRERGVALLLVLWLFMVLGPLALEFARAMRTDAMAAVNQAEETRAYYLALAGMNRALFDALRVAEGDIDIEDEEEAAAGGASQGQGDVAAADDGAADGQAQPLFLATADGKWHELELWNGKVKVRVTSEEGRIPLNLADEALLTRVVTGVLQQGDSTVGLGARELEEVGTVVSSILDWRDPDELVRVNGAETDYYSSLPQPYAAKNGPFDSVDELLRVRGVTSELFYGPPGGVGLRDVFTVFNRRGKINVRTAPAAVFQVLLGLDAESAAELVASRQEAGSGFFALVVARAVAIDPRLAGLFFDEPPRTVTVEAQGQAGGGHTTARVAAVVDMDDESDEGLRVLRWLDRVPAWWAEEEGAGGGEGNG